MKTWLGAGCSVLVSRLEKIYNCRGWGSSAEQSPIKPDFRDLSKDEREKSRAYFSL